MRPPAVELEHVWLTLGATPVLEDVSLRVEADDYLAILGPNGSGKTTLLQVILGLRGPDAGRVRVLGGTPAEARGRVAYVPQRVHFDPGFPIRVLDAVRLGHVASGWLGRPRPAPADAARAALARVELEALAQRPVGALSGGQLQRVLIARALVQEPELLLLDEPTASLDERGDRTAWDLFAGLTRQMAVVVVSHDIGAIARSVRNVACLNRRLFAHPTHELTQEMLEATYGCPVDLLAHGHPHRVLGDHGPGAAPPADPHPEPGREPRR